MFGHYRVSIALLAASFVAPIAAQAVTVDTAFAPSNDLSLTLSAISGAQKWIELNIYELTSPEIADALINRIQAGVQVVILAEGQPVGGLSTVSKGVQGEIVQAMNRFPRTDHFYEMTSKAGGTRRFHYDHAKYAVIDGTSVLIGSENYSPTGNPQPGSVGNRGWEVVVHDVTFATEFSRVFANDATTRAGDVLELTGQAPSPDTIGQVPPAHFPNFPPGSLGVMTLQASAVTPLTSPDTSLNGLVNTIRSARTSLDIEQMTFNAGWAPVATTSPLLTEVVAAARRGVRVRVLLNDETVFNPEGSTSRPVNPVTVQELNQLGAQGLPIQAKIANLKAMGVDYIHNKGVIVDGVRTVISSINWDENAVQKNREAAVVIDSPDVGSYYSKIFDSDWTVSGGTPTARVGFVSPLPLAAADLVPLPAPSCPSELQVQVEIGELVASDLDDHDYLSLSGKTITGAFVRKEGDVQCLLVEKDATGPISNRHFLELGTTRAGAVTAQLDGFTPRTAKVYSVRATIPRGSSIPGSFAGSFFAGPSSREKLGPAVMNLLAPR